jgi:NTE family protein
VAIALGGGGARGLSHLGVLEVLERERIPIRGIAGTSVGAVVAAAYALEPHAGGLTAGALAYLKSSSFQGDLFKRVLFRSEGPVRRSVRGLFSSLRKGYVYSGLLRRPSIFPADRLRRLVEDLIPARTFEEARVPLVIPALDIRSGEMVLLDRGPLREAVLAGCSLPGFFPPLEHGGRLLVDAGVLGPVPVAAAIHRFGPAPVLAVDISPRLDAIESIGLGIEALLRVESIAGKRLNEIDLHRARVVIRPEVGDRSWSDFSGLDALVALGRQAAEGRLPEIRALFEA